MKGEARKAAVQAYRERTATAGIYAVRCSAAGSCWVGRAPDLATVRNRLWFTLRLGSNPHRNLQAAWRAHGEASFEFEELERLDDKLSPELRNILLKKRAEHWREVLAAVAV